MRIRGFDYYAAEDLGDVLSQLKTRGSHARLLAGGTDLVLALKRKTIAPSCLISLNKVRELDYIHREVATVRIGAMTNIAEIAANEIVRDHFPVLSEATSLIGSWQIRNVATIGGNLCTASPAADSAIALLALDAHVVIVDASGQTELPLTSFFAGPGKTVLRRDQILKEITIPIPTGQAAGCYLKLMRRNAVDVALVGVAFQAELDESKDRLEHVAIGLGGVAPTPIRATKAEAVLAGLSYAEATDNLPEAAREAVKAAQPISDMRASLTYRRAIVRVYVERTGEKSLRELYRSEGSRK